jgi:hypothetical protein
VPVGVEVEAMHIGEAEYMAGRGTFAVTEEEYVDHSRDPYICPYRLETHFGRPRLGRPPSVAHLRCPNLHPPTCVSTLGTCGALRSLPDSRLRVSQIEACIGDTFAVDSL